MRKKITSTVQVRSILLTLLLALATLIHSCKKDEPAVPAPTITDFSPVSGFAGASVTITGTNFDPTPGNDKVDFNGISANIISASSTSLTVTVPTGPVTGKISVSG